MNRDFNKVFDLLVSIGGAPKSMRESFVIQHTGPDPCDEYCFQGTLGFGGKYWRRANKVTCYSGDQTPARLKTIRQLNKALAKLRVSAVKASAPKFRYTLQWDFGKSQCSFDTIGDLKEFIRDSLKTVSE